VPARDEDLVQSGDHRAEGLRRTSRVLVVERACTRVLRIDRDLCRELDVAHVDGVPRVRALRREQRVLIVEELHHDPLARRDHGLRPLGPVDHEHGDAGGLEESAQIYGDLVDHRSASRMTRRAVVSSARA